MALTTGDFAFYYGLVRPEVTDETGAIGGAIDTGSPFVFSNTGFMNTGNSALAGAGSDVWYSKVFIQHEGVAGELLANPQLYITNDNVSDQVSLALDPAYTGYHTAQTGQSDNRRTLPDGVQLTDFVNYRGDSALVLNDVATGSGYTLDSGDSVGFWVKVSIPAGLSSAYTNTFNIVLRGEAS